MSTNPAALNAGMPFSTTAEVLRVQADEETTGNGVEITPTNDVNNLDSSNDEVGGRATIGEGGFLILEGSQNPLENNSPTNFSVGGGVQLGRFGLEAIVDNPTTADPSIGITGKVGITEDFSITGGVDGITGEGGINGSVEINGNVGEVEINVEGKISPTERSVEAEVTVPIK